MDNETNIRRSAGRNELSHAYIIIGDSAAQRAKLALFLAQALNCENDGGDKPCGHCRSCRKIAALAHPDIIYLERLKDKREISVDQIRALNRDCYVLPNEGSRKVFILPEADTMNLSAQNALLKLLEEPPAYAAFLLCGSNSGSFLPTIRSRCVLLRAEGQAEAEKDSRAEALADAFVSGDLFSLLRQCFRLEKLDRDTFDGLMDSLYAAAVRRAVSGAPNAVRLAELADRLREMRSCNVSAGHCLGLLMSEVNSEFRIQNSEFK